MKKENTNGRIQAFLQLVLFLFLFQTTFADTAIPARGYVGKRFQQQGSDVSSQFILHQQIGLPLKGYVVANDGNVAEHVIAYQEPEKLLANEFDLAICHEANGKKVDVLNPQQESNFASWVKKDQIRAFFVGEQLFVKGFKNKWYILLSEGAIRQMVALNKVVNNGVTGYAVTEYMQKLDQEPVGLAGLALSYKNTMSSMVHEHKELAEKIKKKEKGFRLLNLTEVIKTYNEWYNRNFPGEVHYVMPYAYNITANSIEELGNLVHQAFKGINYDIIVGISPCYSDMMNTVQEKITDPDLLQQARNDIKRSFNKEVFDANKNAFFSIVNDLTLQGIEKMKFEKFEFIQNSNRTQNTNIQQGSVHYEFSIDGVMHRIRIRSVWQLKTGWKLVDFYLVKEDFFNQLTEEVIPVEQVEEAAPAESFRSELPEKFHSLYGEWTFQKALMNGKDVSKELTQFFIYEQAITVKYLYGGKIVYPVQAEEQIKITGGYWTYFPDQERDLEITTYMTNGSSTTKFKIIRITPTEFVYEDTKAKVTYFFKR